MTPESAGLFRCDGATEITLSIAVSADFGGDLRHVGPAVNDTTSVSMG